LDVPTLQEGKGGAVAFRVGREKGMAGELVKTASLGRVGKKNHHPRRRGRGKTSFVGEVDGREKGSPVQGGDRSQVTHKGNSGGGKELFFV